MIIPQTKIAFKPQINVRHAAGFTLIEIMVVVVIIGLMVALLTVNLSRDLDRLARLEANRFMAIVNEVRDEAIIAGESFILTVDTKKTNYRFIATRENSNSGSDDLLKLRALQEGIKLKWRVFDDISGESEPSVVITPLGEITPFNIDFIGDETEFRVFVNDENQLERGDAKSS